jgi:DNA-binding IscR family transcriptional regulator
MCTMISDNQVRKKRIMLCAGLPPRLYESLKALCCLANAAGPLQAHEIAAAAGLPPAQTPKILQLMTWAGFVESRRGTKGGFWLVTPPKRIRVTDVADFFVHHTQGHPPQKRDGLLKALEQATARCRKEFAHITVADLAKVCECEPTGPSRARRTVSTRQHRKPAPSKSAA